MSFIKRFIFFVPVCLCLFFTLNANSQRLGFGITGGFGLSNASWPKREGQFSTSSASQNVGIVFQHLQNKWLGIQVELRFAQRPFTFQNTSSTYTRSNQYIELPLLSHFELPARNFKFFINMGPQFGLALTSKETFSGDMANIDAYTIANRRSSAFQFGVTAGIGIGYEFPFGLIQAEGRAYLSLTNIFSPREFRYFQFQELNVQISYIYPFRKNKEKPTKTPSE